MDPSRPGVTRLVPAKQRPSRDHLSQGMQCRWFPKAPPGGGGWVLLLSWSLWLRGGTGDALAVPVLLPCLGLGADKQRINNSSTKRQTSITTDVSPNV